MAKKYSIGPVYEPNMVKLEITGHRVLQDTLIVTLSIIA